MRMLSKRILLESISMRRSRATALTLHARRMTALLQEIRLVRFLNTIPQCSSQMTSWIGGTPRAVPLQNTRLFIGS
jgi:hypothetical protein